MTGPARPFTAPPAAALFDLDGTLIDREPLMLEAVRGVFAAAGSPLSVADIGAWVGRAWQDVYVGLDMGRTLGVSFEASLDLIIDEADRLRAGGFETRVLPGAADLVRSLHGAGVPVAVVTGSQHREVPWAVERVGVEDVLALVVAADDYVIGKPDPACFLLAAERLGVLPAACVVFEDSTAGVVAGLAAGMVVVASKAANAPEGHPAHQDLSGAHLVVPTLAALDRTWLGLP